jgi:hypothetical protein
MKKLLLSTMMFCLTIQLFSQTVDYASAKVGSQFMGVYIFFGCEPSNEYDYIGTVDVKWHSGDAKKSFLEAIEKAKKKYPNFNAMIFREYNLEKVDLVKFRGLEISGGGFRIGDYAILKESGKPRYCEIVQLDNIKQKAGCKYLDEYGEEQLSTVQYTKLTIASKEQYTKLIEEQKIDLERHQFTIGEKVTWAEGKNPNYGEVVSLKTKSHDVVMKSLNKYGEPKNATLDFLKVDKIEEAKFQEYREKQLEEIKKHQFEIGQKVSFLKDKKSKCGEVVGLNNKSHDATIKYLGVYADDKTTTEEYFDIEKISDEKYDEEIDKQKKEALQYKFEVGEKIVWKKSTMLGMKSEAINAEVVSLNEIEHKATVKFSSKESVEKQETVPYLDLSKIK